MSVRIRFRFKLSLDTLKNWSLMISYHIVSKPFVKLVMLVDITTRGFLKYIDTAFSQ